MLEDEAEELARGPDAPVLALVAHALRIHERLVQVQGRKAQPFDEGG